uniref:putative Ig domain-containing protein n=1 Tax=Methanococcoides sp. NM1 TaxID=1201013 RepID=UPI001AEF49B7
GDVLSYSVTGLPSGSIFDSSTGDFIWTPSEGQDGNYEVTFEVTDGQLTDSETIYVAVSPANAETSHNNAPLIVKFEPLNDMVFNETEDIAISVEAFDLDGDLLGYLIKIDGVAYSTTSSYIWNTDRSNAGIHNIEVVVSDGVDQVSYQHAITIIDMHPRWDVNRDGVVNIQDVTLVSQNFETKKPHPSWDVNLDGVVNIQDLSIVAYYFGENVG